MFSISTVASSTRIPTASARPPRVMMLMVSPSALNSSTETKIDSGIEIEMTMVGRQSPRNSRIMQAVSAAAIRPSRNTPLIDARTNSDWSNSGLTVMPGGSDCSAIGHDAFDGLDDGQRRALADLVDRHQHAAHAVLAHDVGLRRKAIAHMRHVAHVNRRAVDRLDRQVVQLGDRARVRCSSRPDIPASRSWPCPTA